MGDLDLLNRLSGERDAAREEARELKIRAEAAEKALEAWKTDGAQAEKARKQRDEAIRLRRTAEREREIAKRERDLAQEAAGRLLQQVEEEQNASIRHQTRVGELEQELRDAKDGANTLDRAQTAQIRRLEARIRELEPLEGVIGALREALKPFLR